MVDSYPYGATSQQIPVSITQLNYEGEHSLNAPGETSLSDFDADVGMVQVIVHTPLVASAPLVLQNRAQVSTENDEFIDHYLAIDGNYTPGIFTSPLSATVPHKTFYPILVRPTEDYPVFRAGTLLMAIFSSYQEASPENRIALNSGGQPGACIGVYLVKGRLLT